MTPDQFIAKWKAADLKERAAAQSHFNDLCRMLDEPNPTDADPKGEWYCFERGATKTTGSEGWADVWKRGCFGWEYKSRGRSLDEAVDQLKRYALALENPPLLIACNLDLFRIVTNWTNAVSERHEFDLDGLREPDNREKLKWAFAEPERLRPGLTRRHVTELAAERFAALAGSLRTQGHNPQMVAHFVNRLVFCMFAEDIGLLPSAMFTRMLKEAHRTTAEFEPLCRSLFGAMQTGGRLGLERVEWFDGGLFNDDSALPLSTAEIDLALDATAMDWSQIDPSIMGTLFERGLDPHKRSRLGAHYTDAEKIMKIIEPVIQRPLEAEWAKTRAGVKALLAKGAQSASPRVRTKARNDAERLYKGFLDRLRRFRVFDPACGSGNFLYLALQTLKDLEHRAGIEAEALGLPREFPQVGPEQLLGIEINPYAAELARVSVWIGEIQWMQRNGFGIARNPILRPLETIECRDAILNPDGTEALWPNAHVIVGNPPFLGASRFLRILGDQYTHLLRTAYTNRVPGTADLVSYWFEKARFFVKTGRTSAAGLVATYTLRQGSSRAVLNRIASDCRIFEGWTDQPWINEGAAVGVCLVCFGANTHECLLDGKPVSQIYPDLTAPPVESVLGAGITEPARLPQNEGVSFQGSQKIGSFDISGEIARQWLAMPNPHGRPNSNVLKPLWNGFDVTRRPRDMWVVDFGTEIDEREAALYEQPFDYILRRVKPKRQNNNRPAYRRYWWRHGEPRVTLRASLGKLRRYAVISEKSKHFYFIWLPTSVLPDKRLIVVSREDDTSFGAISSRVHAIWAKRFGSALVSRF